MKGLWAALRNLDSVLAAGALALMALIPAVLVVAALVDAAALLTYRAAWLRDCVGTATPAQAQGSYPTKPIRWVVPSTPGDGSDLTGRLIAEKISRELGQPVIIDFAKVAAGQMPPGLFSTNVPVDRGPNAANSRTYAEWPNKKSSKPPASATMDAWVAAGEASTAAGYATLAEKGAYGAIARWPDEVVPWVALGNARAALDVFAARVGKAAPEIQLQRAGRVDDARVLRHEGQVHHGRAGLSTRP